ncbi:hypothetical protein [Frateuria aurantia]|nr:hypothetical protein [Frateuria aurantia]
MPSRRDRGDAGSGSGAMALRGGYDRLAFSWHRDGAGLSLLQ